KKDLYYSKYSSVVVEKVELRVLAIKTSQHITSTFCTSQFNVKNKRNRKTSGLSTMEVDSRVLYRFRLPRPKYIVELRWTLGANLIGCVNVWAWETPITGS
ncbi:unnamed protein product, partial [Ectocarpus fasciculatus]